MSDFVPQTTYSVGVTDTVWEKCWQYAAIARCDPYMGVLQKVISDHRCDESGGFSGTVSFASIRF